MQWMSLYTYVATLPVKLFKLGDFKTTMINFAYRLIAKTTAEVKLDFMNYGYAFDAPEAGGDTCPLSLDAADHDQRFPLQLYHKLLKGSELAGCDILEVGCGRGGGVDAIDRYYQPKSVVGLDLCQESLALANKAFRRPGVDFTVGHAQKLPFQDNQFDLVINVESSHCYSDVSAFFAEVRRVLKPGGSFLYTDFRFTERLVELVSKVENARFEIQEYEDITAKVVLALDQDNLRRLRLLQTVCKTRYQQKQLGYMSGVKGSQMYTNFVLGKTVYYKMVLRSSL
jgi:ubiquinone/menaquinone biosynthesis C-methylase UbiE